MKLSIPVTDYWSNVADGEHLVHEKVDGHLLKRSSLFFGCVQISISLIEEAMPVKYLQMGTKTPFDQNWIITGNIPAVITLNTNSILVKKTKYRDRQIGKMTACSKWINSHLLLCCLHWSLDRFQHCCLTTCNQISSSITGNLKSNVLQTI